jgi:hypothetical protein
MDNSPVYADDDELVSVITLLKSGEWPNLLMGRTLMMRSRV